ASEWLRKCLRDHKSCDRSHDQTWYPKRLLDLRNQQVRLILTASTQPRGPYASMSHCWGPHPFFLTLSAERIEEMRRDIQWARLPRNFQDAITTCRRLGIDYLWIDSLCIIQSGYGSAEDWTEHATLMQFVYANSILTIAATRAASAEGGCFTERDPDLVYPPTVIWSGRQAAAHSDDELWDDGDSHYLKFMNSPLGQRAWVFQERLLSKRMLHFGLDQIFWECDELPNASETFPLGLPDLNPLNDGVARFNIVPSSSIQEYRKGRPLDDSDGLESNWYQIVENYSALELTRPVEDKFVALAGIASRTAALLGDSYVAGM
ncbi:HET-domain-containing protein, partial [Glonium stellatum]